MGMQGARAEVRRREVAAGVTISRKTRQLWKLVQESHAEPIRGEQQPYQPAPEGNGVTFIGHSSFLIELGGRVALVDPIFVDRLILLRRQRRPGLDWRTLPAVDLVLLTHAHMDHLNLRSLRRVVRRTIAVRGRAPEVVVPRGVEDLVRRVGFAKVHSLSWWQETVVAGVHVTMTPAQHWGARVFRDTHRGFGGYVLRAGGTSVYHSGDTAYFDGFPEIGERLHPHVALLPIGAYFPDSYRAVHTSPEEAVRAFVEVGAETMVAMHFGTFRLGREPFDEPPVRVLAEAERLGLTGRVHVLKEGEMMPVSAEPREVVAAVDSGERRDR